MPQPTFFKHLRVLREAGFVESTVNALRRLNRLRPAPVQEGSTAGAVPPILVGAGQCPQKNSARETGPPPRRNGSTVHIRRKEIESDNGPASSQPPASAKDGEKWTLFLVGELRDAPETVWRALTDPAQLRQWAPFEVDGRLNTAGNTVNLTWAGTGRVSEATVTRADAPQVLEFHDIRWELEPLADGTRLTLWHSIDRRFVSWGAAGWHISLDVLDRLLAGRPIGRIAGADAMKFAGWQRLIAEYSKQFSSASEVRHE